MRAFFFFFGLIAASCGGKTDGTDGGAGKDASTPGSDAAMCTYKDTRTAEDRKCMSSDECTLVIRSVTCCQEQHGGIRKDKAAAFDTQQKMLTGGCPGCGCAAQPIDDVGVQGNATFVVRCDMGTCTSHAL